MTHLCIAQRVFKSFKDSLRGIHYSRIEPSALSIRSCYNFWMGQDKLGVLQCLINSFFHCSPVISTHSTKHPSLIHHQHSCHLLKNIIDLSLTRNLNWKLLLRWISSLGLCFLYCLLQLFSPPRFCPYILSALLSTHLVSVCVAGGVGGAVHTYLFDRQSGVKG